MSQDMRDELDRFIDEALAAEVSGEPRRVNASSVRAAIESRPTVMIPVWLKVAAVLVAAFLVSQRGSRETTRPPGSSPESPAVASGAVAATASPAPSREAVLVAPRPLRSSRPSPKETIGGLVDEAMDALPGLSIASLTTPDPLSPSPIEAEPLNIPRIEIAPLVLESLPSELDRNSPNLMKE